MERKDESEQPPRKKARTRLVVNTQNLGQLGEQWTVIELPAATKMWEPIDIHFTFETKDGTIVQCHLDCIDYGLCHIQKSKGRTYKTERNTRASFHQRRPGRHGIVHVYLESAEGNGRFYYSDRSLKLIVRREPFRYNNGDCGP